MLATSQTFKDALAHETMRVEPRLRWWFSWNHLLDPVVTLGLNTSINSDLFPAESVLNELRQTTSGSAYGITGNAYTSTDPRYGYRTAPRDSEINPILQLSTRTAGAGGTTAMSRISVDYGQEVQANMLETQLDTLRTAAGTFHGVNIQIFVKNTSDTWVSVYTGTGGTEGRRILNWNGTSWTTSSVNYSATTTIKGVRLEIQDTTAAVWNPRIRYIGAHQLLDVTDDIIEFSVTKSESEQLTYMPFSEPVANTATLTLDNTAQKYAFKALGEIQPHYDMNMRVDFELGADLSYVGGSGIEYIPLGVFYTNGLSYSTDMDIQLDMTDYSTFFQRKFLDDCFYENVSFKFVIKDLLARTGMDAGRANFNLGVTKVDNESTKLPFVWYKADTLLWEGLADMVTSELGTFFIQEDNTYLFTDRKFLNNKIDDGVQWTIDADVDLEHAAQDFTVDANEVEVGWTKTGRNIDQRGIINVGYQLDETTGELVTDYTTSGPIETSSVLWEPGDALVINAAVLYASMTSGQTFIRLDRPLGDTFPTEGIVNIEGEFMSYEGKTIETNYVELLNVVRGIRGTTAAAHNNGAADKTATDAQQFSYHVHGTAPTVTTSIDEGRYIVDQTCPEDPYSTWTAYRPFGSVSNPTGDYAYGMRFNFEDKANANNMAGMFVHAKPSTWGGDKDVFDTYWIEVVSTDQLAQEGFDITGSLRVYRTTDKHTMAQRSGLPPTTDHAIYGHDGPIMSDDIPINIDVYWDASAELFSLYVNDVFMTSWQASYVDGEITHPDAQTSPWKDNYYDANLTGNWGFYVRGDTKISVEYIYGGDIERAPEEYVSNYIYGGFASKQYLRKQTATNFLEYGSVVHELRQFDIEHQVWPNRWVRVFNSNEIEAQVLNEEHNSFRSKFEVLNISRTPAVLVGNDQSPYNNGLGANHQFFIYGATVIEVESGEETARDKAAIKRRGISNVRVESPWIQSPEQAEEIAGWVTENWASPVDFYEIEWFPMWALQPGDRIDINYPEKGF